jgi:hypothetical protein
MNRLLVSRHIIFDESSFPFASSGTPRDDLHSLFSSSLAIRTIAPPYPSSVAGTLETVAMPRMALTPLLLPHASSAPLPASQTTPTPPPAPRKASVSPLAPRAALASLFAPRATSASRFAQRLLVYQRQHLVPALEPSCAGQSVYHLISFASDPRSTHPMVTRRVAGVTKPVDCLQLSTVAAPPTLSTVPTSVRSMLVDPHCRCAMEEYEVCCPTTCGT